LGKLSPAELQRVELLEDLADQRAAQSGTCLDRLALDGRGDEPLPRTTAHPRDPDVAVDDHTSEFGTASSGPP
jgi:hypothetical protein